MNADNNAIGQESVVFNDEGKVLCKGVYEGSKEGRYWLRDEKGGMHSFPADKYDIRPSRDKYV